MILTLLTALFLGLVIGPVARLIVPGKQDVSLVVTVLLGATGALVGSVVVTSLTGENGFDILALLAGLAAAVLLVVIYGFATGRTGGSSA